MSWNILKFLRLFCLQSSAECIPGAEATTPPHVCESIFRRLLKFPADTCLLYTSYSYGYGIIHFANFQTERAPGFGTAKGVARAIGLEDALRPLGLEICEMDNPVPVSYTHLPAGKKGR